jgi:type IV pilus assembly protein PilV
VERGFAMLDALIAIVILAVGVLAFASVQANVLVSQRSTKMRQYALVFSEDILDRARANRAGLADYAFAGIPPAIPACGDDIANPCDPSAMAELDVAAWADRLDLMGFDVTRSRIAVNTGVTPAAITVDVVWVSPDAADSMVRVTAQVAP